MTIGSPKYFGEQAFNDVYCKLVEKARSKQKPIHYEEVATIMGKKPEEKMGHYWANETGHMLKRFATMNISTIDQCSVLSLYLRMME